MPINKNITIHESLQFFFKSEQNASAVKLILDSKIPRGLKWTDIEQYNTALVSAQVTRLEYWKFLRDIFDLTWGDLLNNSTYNEVNHAYYEREYSLEHVWNSELFYKCYEFKGYTLLFHCFIQKFADIQLGFHVESTEGQRRISNELNLSEDGWTDVIEKERNTQEGLFLIEGKSEINIKPLINLAQEVVSKLSERI